MKTALVAIGCAVIISGALISLFLMVVLDADPGADPTEGGPAE